MNRILRKELGVAASIVVALAGNAQAQGRTAIATTLQTDATGAITTTTTGTAPTGGGGSESLILGGALWTRANPDWTPKVVSIGAQGTQVFSQVEFGQDHAELISSFSPDPALPAWSTNVPAAGTNAFCESAETSDAHATVHQIVQNNNNSVRVAVVSRWRSGSTTPEWSWSFPGTTAGLSRVGISADGSRIVAATLYPPEMKLRIAVFQGSSGTPVYQGEINNFGVQFRGFEMAADGNSIYAASSGMAYVWRVDTHTVVGQAVLPSGFDSHALSGDGRVFAWGEFNKVHIFERGANGLYAQTHVRELTGPLVCDRLALSANGATLAIGWHYYDQNLRVRLEALDVPSKTLTMSDEAQGSGTYQNIVNALSVSDDGQRFAAGLWGDQGDLVPEVRLYRRNQNAPVALHNLTGSVYDLEMSGDGERVAVAWKPVHANTFAGGGGYSLYAFEDMDLRVSGVPTLGSSVAIDVTGPANSPARLLWSRFPATTPNNFPGVGVLRLRRWDMTLVNIANADADGNATAVFPLPTQASQIGQTLYFQGFFTSPRRLTSDWARVTILP